MRRKTLAILTCLMLFCVGILGMTACDKSTDGLEYSINDDGKTVSVVGVGTALEKEIVIPSKYKDFEVTAISEYAFMECKFITDITIPKGITSIGEYAFYNCSNLTSITLPSSVTKVDSGAFTGCNSITKINYIGTADKWVQGNFFSSLLMDNANLKLYFKNKLVKKVKITTATTINNHSFYGCTSLQSVTIGNSVKSIGGSAFTNCRSLTSVTIGSEVESIEGFAFSNCTSLTSITIPNKVRSIGVDAFRGCDSLTNVTFEDTSTWYRSSSVSFIKKQKINVEDSSYNATQLKGGNVYSYYWYKL